MASNSRSSSYTCEEDIHLCHVYLDISKNLIIGIYQSKDQFWCRCCMWVILVAVGKLRGCNYQKWFKFNHSPKSPSPRLSSFSLNLSDDNVGGILLQRPIGVKKSKLKRKKDEQISVVANAIEDETQQFMYLLKHRFTDREQNYHFQKKLALAEMREENKVLLKDLNSITDLKVREYF
ncbi:hypothetical protein Pfo_020356 [Paulownia fortunei]|nr:hypothetical protein Pfo_020356 [Paulownia fortunei]